MNEKKKLITLVGLSAVKPLMNWDDIEVGEIYHLPPLIYNKRMDFVVVSKDKNTIKVKRFGTDYCQTMFRTDITSRFIVKKIDLHG